MPPRPGGDGLGVWLTLYQVVTRLLEPAVPSILRGRAKRGKEDPIRIGERFGCPTCPRPSGTLVWLHGVSVGESQSLLPLVSALKAARPEINILVTSGTKTSANLLAKRLPPDVIYQYAPVDVPGAVGRFLDHWHPSVGVLVESELWPNLILKAQARGVKLVLASARITAKSAAGWQRMGSAPHQLLSAFKVLMPQDAETAGRLEKLGGTIGPFANLKRVGQALAYDPEALKALKASANGRPVILASNTHPGEENLICQAGLGLGALLVVAPRHPERGNEVATSLEALGLKICRRSKGETLSHDHQVYLADTLGEMGLLYAWADVAVMGGSFYTGIGGHNPLEPARMGVPVITGPYVFNASDLYGEMLDVVAAIEVADGPELTRSLTGLIAHPHIRQQMTDAALAYAARQGAALDTVMSALLPLIDA